MISKITTAKAAQSKKYESILGHSYFQATVEQGASIELTDKSERAQLLRAFCELMDNYPDAPFDDNLTIEEIEDYCEASEVHHEKVLRLAEYLLPELSSLLNESKIKFTHLWEAKC